MILVSVQEMKSLEETANNNGVSYEQMMFLAGSGVANEVDHRYRDLIGDYHVIGLVGPGNNGGDTLISLRVLFELGWDVVALVYHRDLEDTLIKELLDRQITVRLLNLEAIESTLSTNAILLDGLLGTGVKLPIKSDLQKIMAQLKDHIRQEVGDFIVVAVDTPSGIDCETGETSREVLPAHLTISMGAVKKGLIEDPALDACGEIMTTPIGFDSVIPGWEEGKPVLLDAKLIRTMLPRRKRSGHKGTFGTGLVVGGSVNYTGAPILAGKAAGRMGAGLIQMGIPSFLHPILAGSYPEATWLLLPEEEGVLSSAGADLLRERFTSVTGVLIGPGLGLESTTTRLMQKLIQPDSRKADHIGFLSSDHRKVQPSQVPPLIIDADGLKVLAAIPDWHLHIPEGTILTPHPGEMAVLTGLTVEEIQQNREETAVKFASRWNCVVVLKGAGTLIADPTGRMYRLPLASTSLAHAGSGDVLAGMILGLRVQGIPAFEAASAAVWIHGKAGLWAALELGHPAAVMAGDLISQIGAVLGSVWEE